MNAFSESKKPQRVLAQEFELDCSSAEKAQMFANLALAAQFFLDQGNSVSLEGFGLLIPERSLSQNAYHHQKRLILREETRYQIRFEKCDDLAARSSEVQGKLIESRELARKIYLSLPLELQLKWSEAQFKGLILAAIQKLKQEVVSSGYSSLLESVGEFYALHNRQGPNFMDWYAGADIFIAPKKQALLKVGNSRAFEIPVLNSAVESFEALNGAALARFNFKPEDLLPQIGYEVGDLEQFTAPAITVSVFRRKDHSDSDLSLLYCTDGFRNLPQSKSSANELPCELVVQMESSKYLGKHDRREPDFVPSWPLKLLAAAWVLSQSSKSKTLKPGLGLSLGTSLVPEIGSELKSILLCNCNLIRLPQFCGNSSFRYLSVTAITEDEAKVAELYSTQFLLRLLEQRNLDQVVKPRRSSLVSKTGLLEMQKQSLQQESYESNFL